MYKEVAVLAQTLLQKKYIQIVSEPMPRWSTSQIVREMQIEPKVRYRRTPVRTVIVKTQK